MLLQAKILAWWITVSIATLAVTFCQTPQVATHTHKHQVTHRHKEVAVGSKPAPTPATPNTPKPSPTPVDNATYLVQPDGRWEWIPPGPHKIHSQLQPVRRPDSF